MLLHLPKIRQGTIDKIPNPSEAEVREALSGVLCRCTGYIKPVQAVLKAAESESGEINSSGNWLNQITDEDIDPHRLDKQPELPYFPSAKPITALKTLPKIVFTPEVTPWQRVGKPEVKVDAIKLVQGKPAFTADIEMKGMLYAKVLRSLHAHARIKHIDSSKARAIPGGTILTWQDIPRVVYSTAGQSDPIPGPLDAFSLDYKVRFVGDRVAFVAAETTAIAEQALKLIEVDYEILPPLLNPDEATQPGKPILHDEPEYVNFAGSDPSRNIAAQIRIDIGDVEKGFAEADFIFEGVYEVPKVQQAHIEPHVVITIGMRMTDYYQHQPFTTFHARRIPNKAGGKRMSCSFNHCHWQTCTI
jgi:putative selenate reductase molybdopterin-binding subunit